MNTKIYIAGPCAAESEEQVMGIARTIADLSHVHGHRILFRAGLWKPRTSPDSYQGAGEKGLVWLQRVQQELGLETATEVANAEQVRKAMEAGIPYLWVGARTSANPIAVQEIADSIIREECSQGKETLKGIFIKNPVNEDAALWVGNIERLKKTGKDVMAIHRGCNHRPCWQMAYYVRQSCKGIKLLLDPSHMSGDAQQVPSLCEKGLILGYDGWMIEVHSSPELALSDASQQIHPDMLETIICQQIEGKEEDNELTWLRAMMDETDDALWNVLNRRMDISRRIGKWKRTNDMPIVQPERYQDMLQRRSKWASEHNISMEAVVQIMDAIHKESVRQQA